MNRNRCVTAAEIEAILSDALGDQWPLCPECRKTVASTVDALLADGAKAVDPDVFGGEAWASSPWLGHVFPLMGRFDAK